MPRNVIITGLRLPGAVLVDIEGPWRILAEADAGGLVNLGTGRKATVMLTLPDIAALLEAVPAQAVDEDVMGNIRGIAKHLRET